MSGDRPGRSDVGADAAGATVWSADTGSRSDRPTARRATARGATATDSTATDSTATDSTATDSTATDTSATANSAMDASAVDSHTGDDRAQLVRHGAHVVDARAGNDAADLAAEEAEQYVDPKVGPADLARLPGPFTPRQLARIDEALSLATSETGLLFSLYVGELGAPTRAAAERLAGRLPSAPEDGAVLVAASPGQRVLHIVTTRDAVRRLPNRVCALAALSMRASFSGGDLTAGAVNGLRMLADAAGHYSGSHLPALAPAPAAATRADPGRR